VRTNAGRTTAIILIVVAVVVAVAIVLAAVLYVMVSGLLSGGTVVHPIVALTLQTGVTGATATVASVSFVMPLARFRATLFVNTTTVESINPLREDHAGVLQFTDLGGDGQLNGGDRFLIQRTTPGAYELVLYWEDSSEIVSTSWTI